MDDSQATSKGATSKVSRTRKNASNMWDHYERISNPTSGICDHTKCNYCGKVLSYKVTSGTSSMKKHLKKCSCYPHNVDKKQKQLSSNPGGNNEASPSHISQGSSMVEESGGVDGNDDDIYIEDELMRFIRDEQDVEPKSELEKYFEEACEDGGKDLDILGWWKSNRFKYKILSQIARDVLAIPVSTVASESAFGTSGRVLDPFRSCLTPKIVQSLICTQDWLRVAPTPLNIEELMEDAEKYEAEASGLMTVDDIVDSATDTNTDDDV